MNTRQKKSPNQEKLQKIASGLSSEKRLPHCLAFSCRRCWETGNQFLPYCRRYAAEMWKLSFLRHSPPFHYGLCFYKTGLHPLPVAMIEAMFREFRIPTIWMLDPEMNSVWPDHQVFSLKKTSNRDKIVSGILSETGLNSLFRVFPWTMFWNRKFLPYCRRDAADKRRSIRASQPE